VERVLSVAPAVNAGEVGKMQSFADPAVKAGEVVCASRLKLLVRESQASVSIVGSNLGS
jgi:hypothetical protein